MKAFTKKYFENSFFEKKINQNLTDFSDSRYLMLRDIITYLPGNLLVKTDRASMFNSLEIRSPYLDVNLVKLAWRLPDSFLINNTEKVLLKYILGEKFSTSFVNRKKQGFEPPLYKWLRGPLNEWAKDLLFSNNIPLIAR